MNKMDKGLTTLQTQLSGKLVQFLFWQEVTFYLLYICKVQSRKGQCLVREERFGPSTGWKMSWKTPPREPGFRRISRTTLRATTVTVLSSVKVETRQIKAMTVHKSDATIESYCERPTLHQFQHMSSALTWEGKHGTNNNRVLSRFRINRRYASPKLSSWNDRSTKTNQHLHHSKQRKRLISNGVNQNSCYSTIGHLPWMFFRVQHKHQQVMR